MWLIKLSITRPVFILMIELFLLVMGVIGYFKIGVDLYPKIDPPVITITTEYPGAGPEEIETLVSKPIEEQVNQIGGIDRIVSTSRENISQIVIEFKLEIDAKVAQNEVRDKLARVRPDLPIDVEEPLLERLDFENKPVLQLALRNRYAKEDMPTLHVPESRLRILADDLVKPRIQQIDGVGQVNIFGGLEREIQIDLDRQKLLAWKLTPSDVATAIQLSNKNIPAGEIKEEPLSRSLRVLGQYEKISEINETIVKTLEGGREIRVSDVGTTRDTYKDRESFARVNGEPVVLLEVKKQSDANTVKVTDRILERVAAMKSSLPMQLELIPAYDGAARIRMSVYDVIETMVIAAILTVLVVYLFLGSMQSTFITGIALPTTVVTTFFGLYYFNFTLNVMTLLGLTLAVGLVLDDAIVVRENIWSKMERGMSPKEASMTGTQQVFIAVIATSATILATFLPVTLIPGIVGRFFSAFALTICIAVIFSTFDAITIAPMLSAYLMRQHGENKIETKPNRLLAACEWFGGHCSAAYRALLEGCLSYPKTTIATAAVVFLASVFAIKYVGFTFLPDSENGELEVFFEAPPGTTFAETDRIARDMESVIRAIPEVAFQSTRVGTELAETNKGSLYVRLVPYGERSVSTGQMKVKLRKLFRPMVDREKLTLAIADAGGGGGARKPLSLVVQGPSNEELMRLSAAIIHRVEAEVPEVVNLESSLKPGRSELQFPIDRKKATAFGLSVDDIGQTIRGLFEGTLAGKYREDGEEYDIRVHLSEADRTGVRSLEGLTIPNVRNEPIRLAALTTPRAGISPTKVVRINLARSSLIEGDLNPGAPLASAIGKIRTIVSDMLPPGYSFNFQGQAESLGDLQVGAVIALTLGALFIYMIMASLYESFILPFSILLTLPLAVVGAVLSLLVTGSMLDIYSIIGIILLMGLVTKNAILLVDYVEELRAEGMSPKEALLEAGLRRMRPIMMTTVAMIAGTLPIAMGYGELNKSRAGMGIGCIGGMISSTFLSLIVVPCAYLYLDRLRSWSLALIKRYY